MSILGFRVKGFEVPISNFGKGFSELDFQNFDAHMPKIVSKPCFFVKISLKNQFFFYRKSFRTRYMGHHDCIDALFPDGDIHDRNFVFTEHVLKKKLANKIFGYCEMRNFGKSLVC